MDLALPSPSGICREVAEEDKTTQQRAGRSSRTFYTQAPFASCDRASEAGRREGFKGRACSEAVCWAAGLEAPLKPRSLCGPKS